mmetsp:Transcript_22957/g.23608  ORF Transcript_22957/g.23608 Transcript_22957/m.23608 type:complete len:166 (-) Transcript_22957:110-607(-)
MLKKLSQIIQQNKQKNISYIHTSSILLGGARPGGKPTFNWKQKLILKEDKEQEVALSPILPYGSSETTPQFDKIFGHFKKIDLSSLEEFDSSEYAKNNPSNLELGVPILGLKKDKSEGKDRIRSPRYKIQTHLLFGSNKVGYLIKKPMSRRTKALFGKNGGEVKG